jgi:hypothetical protein
MLIIYGYEFWNRPFYRRGEEYGVREGVGRIKGGEGIEGQEEEEEEKCEWQAVTSLHT